MPNRHAPFGPYVDQGGTVLLNEVPTQIVVRERREPSRLDDGRPHGRGRQLASVTMA